MSKSTSKASISSYSYKIQDSEIKGCSYDMDKKIDDYMLKTYGKKYKVYHIIIEYYDGEWLIKSPFIGVYDGLSLKKIAYINGPDQEYYSKNINNFKKFLKKKGKLTVKISILDHVFLCIVDNDKKSIETIDFKEYMFSLNEITPVMYRSILTPLFYHVFKKDYSYYHHDISKLTEVEKHNKEKLKIISRGFCYAYSTYFIEQIIKNPNSSIENLAKSVIKRALKEPVKFTKYIAGYAQHLHSL